MGTDQIRLLRADEIECRTGIIREHGLSLLLYKDARVDQSILDEAFGICGWKREHQIMDGKMFCTISIKDENGEWVPKQDVGTESYSEPTKGAASDSFKRAAFNIGIGRELYTAPFIWLPSSVVRLERRGDKWVTKDSFHVAEIRYDERIRSITGLRICNQDQLPVYEYGLNEDYTETSNNRSYKAPSTERDDRKAGTEGAPVTVRSGRKKKNTITGAQVANLRRELARTGVAEFLVLQRYGVAALESMDEENYMRAMSGLQKTPTAA